MLVVFAESALIKADIGKFRVDAWYSATGSFDIKGIPG